MIIQLLENRKMNSIKKIIFGLCCLATIGLTSCNLMGLDLQKDYDYKSTPTKLTMDMTAYQFIESRKNIDMSLLYEAINRVQYKDTFETKNRTYIILNDIAFSNQLTYQKYAELKYMPNSEIVKLLNKHIIKGLYHSLSLTTTPVQVETLDPTIFLSICLESATMDSQNKYQVLVKRWGSTGNAQRVVTSNLQPTNGIMHVVDYPL